MSQWARRTGGSIPGTFSPGASGSGSSQGTRGISWKQNTLESHPLYWNNRVRAQYTAAKPEKKTPETRASYQQQDCGQERLARKEPQCTVDVEASIEKEKGKIDANSLRGAQRALGCPSGGNPAYVEM